MSYEKSGSKPRPGSPNHPQRPKAFNALSNDLMDELSQALDWPRRTSPFRYRPHAARSGLPRAPISGDEGLLVHGCLQGHFITATGNGPASAANR